jgi:CHASE3 domain sensor protein
MSQILVSPQRGWPLIIALTVPLLLLLGVGVLWHRSLAALQDTSRALRETSQTKERLRRVLAEMVNNETGQRGFVLSQRPEFLQPYEHSLQVLPELRRAVASKLTDRTSREQYESLSRAIDLRLAFAAESVDLQRNGRHEASVSLIASGKGKSLMDAVRSRTAEMEGQFDATATAHEAEYFKVVIRNNAVSWGVLAADAIVAVSLVLLVRRLQRDEKLLQVCAWTKTVEHEGEWVSFEEYLARRFGINVSHGVNPNEADRIISEMRQKRRSA